jgi:hypothetical protein
VANEEIATVDGRRLQLDDDLARACDRIGHLLEAQLATLVDPDRQHAPDPSPVRATGDRRPVDELAQRWRTGVTPLQQDPN